MLSPKVVIEENTITEAIHHQGLYMLINLEYIFMLIIVLGHLLQRLRKLLVEVYKPSFSFIRKRAIPSMKVLLVITLVYQFFSCAKERDYPFDSSIKEDVVFSINQTNEPIQAQVSETINVLDSIGNFISNAQIIVYEGNVIMDTLRYSENSQNYLSNKIIEPGTEVSLDIKLREGEKTLKSTDRIPFLPKIEAVELEEDVLTIFDEGDEIKYSRLTLALNEDAANTNYNVILKLIPVNEGETLTAFFDNEYISDPDVINAQNVFYEKGVIIKNNTILGQKKLELQFIVYLKPENEDYYYELEVQSISENQYRYLKDVYNVSGEDEVFNVFTNIDGGKGLFSFYSVFKDTIYPNQQ